jgi:hypothetical protein
VTNVRPGSIERLFQRCEEHFSSKIEPNNLCLTSSGN